ncbi:B12-binding domain-containing radical SAM protein [Schlesneria paludicola]|uniref:B12-binding domain-containing radical SAM protein n=1 Tax=Schlesneria paludicola TaxID=360056 RepID=UPI00058C017E|nr:B12-binding domain-containing radical SAM protein [Schlesneria paludicola]
MKIGLIAMSGVRAWDPELLELGLSMPGFVERKTVIAQLPSLGLLTLAGLTPRHDDVSYHELFDIAQDPLPNDDFDLIAISSFTAQIEDAYQVADGYRARHVPVVLGGLHVSSLPEEALLHADAIVIGEAEEVWPIIVEDARRGELKRVYRPSRPWRLVDSPIPRFDLLDPEKYNRITVQTSRGCPWKCDFCASSILIAPHYQVKPVSRVVEEIRRIKSIWPRPFIEFADDNTFVNKKHSKLLMRALIPERIRFFTETDLSFADDPDLIALARDAGCRQVLIGFESPTLLGLDGMELHCNWKLKQQERSLAAIERIQSAGITVNGCFILGLDGQTPEVFGQILEFVKQSGLYDVQVTLQTPFPGTPLYDRLRREGRLFENRYWEKCTLFDLTHEPQGMSSGELRAGLISLSQAIYDERATHQRHDRFFSQLRTSSALAQP